MKVSGCWKDFSKSWALLSQMRKKTANKISLEIKLEKIYKSKKLKIDTCLGTTIKNPGSAAGDISQLENKTKVSNFILGTLK